MGVEEEKEGKCGGGEYGGAVVDALQGEQVAVLGLGPVVVASLQNNENQNKSPASN